MNYYIGAAWDLDYIVQRKDFSSNDLLRVFLKPSQKWNYDLIAQRFGKDWCTVFAKVEIKLLDSLIKFSDKVDNPFAYKESLKRWLNPSFHRIINSLNGGWNDYDDADNFCLEAYFEEHETFAANTFEKQMRHFQLREELLPITWHPDRVIDWCFDEEEKKELCVLWDL